MGIPARKRSGGPRTDTGKSVSSKNSLSVGLYSMTVILPGESEAEFEQLLEQFIRDFSPKDIVESSMVHDLTILLWKKARLERLEHTSLLRELNLPCTRAELAILKCDASPDDKFGLIKFVRMVSDADLQRYLETGKQILDWLERGQVVLGNIESLAQKHPYLNAHFLSLQEKCFGKPLSPSEILGATIEIDGDRVGFVMYALRSFLTQHELVIWAAENLPYVRKTIMEIQEGRLLALAQRNNSRRAQDDLDRAFYKTLSELRRHQKWQREQNTVTINPIDRITPSGEDVTRVSLA